MKLLRITTVPISLNILLRGQLRYMQEQGFEVLTISSAGPEIEEVKEREGVEHQMVEMTRTISPWKDLMALYNLVRIMIKYKPDIVHTHTPKAGLLGMIASWLCKVPVRLHTVAGMPLMETTGFKKKLLLFTEWLTYACATNVYPNSYNLLNYIKSNISIEDERLKVIGHGSTNGINLQYFSRTSTTQSLRHSTSQHTQPPNNPTSQPHNHSTTQPLNHPTRSKLNLPEDAFIFIFIGRLVKDKGINELVRSFVKISLKFPQTHLLLVGPFEPDLDPIATETEENIKNHNHITTTGFQKDVRPFLQMSDVFVFPSYREGFPNVVLQAGSMDLPCIVSDINGCNEIITNKRNGIIVPPKDDDTLYHAMEAMIVDEGLRNRLARNARKEIIEKYDQQFVWAELLKEYREQMLAKKKVE